MLKKTCCYLCLSVNKRTINIYKTDLLYVYEKLAVLKIRGNECWMCYICYSRLRQCHRLQQLAVQTRGLIDDLCQNKINIEFETFGSLLELSIFKMKNFSTTHPSITDIKQESDVKTEPCCDGVINEDEYEDNTNDYEENDQLKESEDNNLLLSDAGCKQDSLNVDRNDAWQGSKVLELKIVRLSQTVIDKYVRQSPTIHTVTGEYHEDRAEQTAALCADQQEEIKLKIGGKGIGRDDERDNTNDCEGRDHTSETQSGCYRKRLSCDVCSRTFRYKSRLIRHIRTHMGDKLYNCRICHKKIIHKSNLFALTKRHGGEKTFDCDKELSLFSNDKKIICKVCQKDFVREIEFNRQTRVHTGEKPYSYVICQKKFAGKGYLTVDTRTHTGEKSYSCDICQKKFAHRSQLNVHIRTHTGEKPYSCDICQKKFAHRSQLNVHIRTHTGEKPYICDICQKKFAHRFQLNVHIRTHTGEKPYSCDMCQKKFARSGQLNLHTRTHTDEKPYSCIICQKKFRRRDTLNEHTRTHTGEKPYSCNICQKKFAHRHNLNRHIGSHKGEIPAKCVKRSLHIDKI